MVSGNDLLLVVEVGDQCRGIPKGKSFNVPVTGNLDFNHAAPAVEACVTGLGFGMFISYQVAPWLAAGKLLRKALAFSGDCALYKRTSARTALALPGSSLRACSNKASA